MSDSAIPSASSPSNPPLLLVSECPSSGRTTQSSRPSEDLTAGGPSSAERASSTEFDEGDIDQQTWAEFLQNGFDRQSDTGQGNMSSTTVAAGDCASSAAGKKRRLTGSAADATSHGRVHNRTRQDQPRESSPTSPELVAQMSWRNNDTAGPGPGPSPTPGSSRENAIDISASPQSVSRQLNSLRDRESSFTDHRLPRWQPDSEVSKCPICDTTFSFWYRKHHCRKCGRVVCASCSPHRITIPRQFIVRPPEAQRPLSMIIQPSSTPSPPPVINLVDDDVEDGASAGARDRQEPWVASNPALGGGEEVRLCNPCVPDPNPEPPRRYSTIGHTQAGLQRRTSQRSQSYLPGRSDSTNELRRQRDHGMIYQPETPDLHRNSQTTPANERLPFYGTFDYTAFPGVHGRPPSYHSLEGAWRHGPLSPLIYSSSASPLGSRRRSGYSSSRPTPPTGHRTHSHSHSHSYNAHVSARNRPLPRPPVGERYQGINDQDLCPVCNLILPPRAANGSEEAREAHIHGCIERLSGHTQVHSGVTHSQSESAVGMLHFTATEKDCVGGDGAPQECTICMEEYEVGVQLTRLECLCKFHKICITHWLQRKQECPVHKVS